MQHSFYELWKVQEIISLLEIILRNKEGDEEKLLKMAEQMQKDSNKKSDFIVETLKLPIRETVLFGMKN